MVVWIHTCMNKYLTFSSILDLKVRDDGILIKLYFFVNNPVLLLFLTTFRRLASIPDLIERRKTVG